MTTPAASLVVIGNFDGVHRGHQAVLETVSRLAAARALVPTLLTFDPHPAVTLGRIPPPLLTTLARKVELVRRACPGIAVAAREFSQAFARQSPEAFVDDVLLGELGARAVMVGSNFRFGRDRAGGVDELAAFGRAKGFELAAEPLVGDTDGPFSSTRARTLIAQGDLDEATRLLGRPHMVSGVVSHGRALGRTIGFPTCNLPQVAELLPSNGVYAVVVDRVEGGHARALAKGVANLGIRPTVSGEGAPLLEVHLFDLEESLYGVELRVHLVTRLREERTFDGLGALKQQIARDADDARGALVGLEPNTGRDGAWW